MTNDDRKCWYYRKHGRGYMNKMEDLPSKWSRKKIRIVYISKKEKQEKVKKQYIKELAVVEKQKQALVTELASVK